METHCYDWRLRTSIAKEIEGQMSIVTKLLHVGMAMKWACNV